RPRRLVRSQSSWRWIFMKIGSGWGTLRADRLCFGRCECRATKYAGTGKRMGDRLHQDDRVDGAAGHADDERQEIVGKAHIADAEEIDLRDLLQEGRERAGQGDHLEGPLPVTIEGESQVGHEALEEA